MKSMGSIVLSILMMAFALMIVHPVNAENVPITATAFQQQRATKNALERLLFARETIHQSSNSEVLCNAVLDLVRYSINDEENQIALDLIDSALQRLSDESEGFHELLLAKGKFLSRLGKIEEAKPIFQEAIDKNWKNGFLRYKECLIEIDEMEEACLVEFKRLAGLPPYGKYRGEEDSLETFITLLRIMKHDRPQQSTLSSIYERIEDIQSIKNDPFCDIAHAICLEEDGMSDKAIALLRQVDSRLAKYRHHAFKSPQQMLLVKNHREYRHIPLYIASIAQKEGQFLVAQTAFTQFMQRNPGKNLKIAESAIQLLWGLSYRGEDHCKADEFATFIIESDWFKDPAVLEEIGEEKTAVFYDQQQIGLNWSGLGDRYPIDEIRLMVMEKYPNTLGGNFCKFCYIRRGTWRDKGVKMMNEILQNTKFDIIAVHVRRYLAELALDNGDWDEALKQAEDGLRHISPYEKGWKREFHRNIEDLYTRILQRR